MLKWKFSSLDQSRHIPVSAIWAAENSSRRRNSTLRLEIRWANWAWAPLFKSMTHHPHLQWEPLRILPKDSLETQRFRVNETWQMCLSGVALTTRSLIWTYDRASSQILCSVKWQWPRRLSSISWTSISKTPSACTLSRKTRKSNSSFIYQTKYGQTKKSRRISLRRWRA